MIDDEKVIKFPGPKPPTHDPSLAALQALTPEEAQSIIAEVATTMGVMSPEQRKAILAIVEGHAFVFVAIMPTDTGADFRTALYGPPEALRNALPHLGDVIGRLYARKGV